MASVDETVREAILCYPTLHRNRTDVLVYILSASGNAWKWENGDAVPERPQDRTPWTAERYDASSAEWIAEHELPYRQMLVQDAARKRADLMQVVASVDERVRDWGTLTNDYTRDQSAYALIMNVPADVAADWAQACEDVRIFLAERGWSF